MKVVSNFHVVIKVNVISISQFIKVVAEPYFYILTVFLSFSHSVVYGGVITMNGGEQERDSLVYLIPNGFLHLPLVYLLFKKFTVKSCLFKNYFFPSAPLSWRVRS